jgi:hypothetical protein
MLLALAAIVAGVAVALLVPITVELRLVVGPGNARPPVRVRVGWAFLSWRSGGRPSRIRRPTHHPPPPREPSRRRFAILAVLRTPGFMARVRRLLMRTGKSLLPTAVDLEAHIGLDDPAQTGVLAGALALLGPLRHPRYDWRVQLDYLQPIVEARADVTWSVRPAAILWPLAVFLMSPVVWQAMRAVRRH